MADFTDVTLNEDERQAYDVTPLKANGSPGSIEAGSVAFTTDSGPAQGVVLSDSQVRIRAMGAAGQSAVRMTADADLGAGVVTITHIFNVNANPVIANGFGVTPSGAAEVDPELP